MNEYEIPHTEQGLSDFIRFGELEIKRSENKIKKLNEMISICRSRLAVIFEQKPKGDVCQSTQEQKNEH